MVNSNFLPEYYYRMGIEYIRGINKPRSLKKAEDYLKKAVKLGHSDSKRKYYELIRLGLVDADDQLKEDCKAEFESDNDASNSEYNNTIGSLIDPGDIRYLQLDKLCTKMFQSLESKMKKFCKETGIAPDKGLFEMIELYSNQKTVSEDDISAMHNIRLTENLHHDAVMKSVNGVTCRSKEEAINTINKVILSDYIRVSDAWKYKEFYDYIKDNLNCYSTDDVLNYFFKG